MAESLSADDVQQLVSRQLAEGLGSSARDAYAAQKMNDLPVTYQQLLPATTDRGQLANAEQRIRSQYRADMRAQVPRFVGKGIFVGGDSSPEALAFHQKSQQAQAAMNAGDLVTAQKLLTELVTANNQQGQPAKPPPDPTKMNSTEKILFGLSQEKPLRRVGGM
jgi:hypothetical protein